MKIMKKILERREFIMNNSTGAGKILANEIGDAGVNAILRGIKTSDGNVTPEWKKLMEFFANDERELARLCGQEEEFNNSEYGAKCLAYIAGNSTCTIETATMTGTSKNFSVDMKKDLDREFEV